MAGSGHDSYVVPLLPAQAPHSIHQEVVSCLEGVVILGMDLHCLPDLFVLMFGMLAIAFVRIHNFHQGLQVEFQS